MKKNELKSIRTKKIGELYGQVNKKKIELVKVKMEIVAGKESDLKKAKNLKREIAQILTIIKEKQIVGELEDKKMEGNVKK